MKFNKLEGNEIILIDPIGCTGTTCNCGKDAMFILGIHGHFINLCEICLGKVGKTVIDGLI